MARCVYLLLGSSDACSHSTVKQVSHYWLVMTRDNTHTVSTVFWLSTYLSNLPHYGYRRLPRGSGHFVLHQVEHVLVIQETDQVEGTKAGGAPQSQISDHHGAGKTNYSFNFLYTFIWKSLFSINKSLIQISKAEHFCNFSQLWQAFLTESNCLRELCHTKCLQWLYRVIPLLHLYLFESCIS